MRVNGVHIKKRSENLFLDVIYELKIAGFPLDLVYQSLLSDYGRINADKPLAKSFKKHKDSALSIEDSYVNPEHIKVPKSLNDADSNVMVIVKSGIDHEANMAIDKLVESYDISEEEIEDVRKRGAIAIDGNIDNLADWKISKDNLENHDKEFHNFILSINNDFRSRVGYWRYNLYVQQSNYFMSSTEHVGLFKIGSDERREYLKREVARFKENNLYWLKKVHKYVSPQDPTGYMRYIPHDAQSILTFLINSGYDITVAKARQVWFTTTVFGLALMNTMYNKSKRTQIITADLKKAERTFEDKVKLPYYGYDSAYKPKKPSNDTKLSISFFKNKLKQEGGMSHLSIIAPSPTAINSGNPDLTLIDEQGLIDCLVEMIEEWRPTKYQYNQTTGKLEPKGQVVAWGTSDQDAFPEFEYVFKSEIERFIDRDFYGTMIPVMFNCYSRAGYNHEMYERDRKRVYAMKGPKAHSARVRFHQANPVSIDDMFMKDADTIIPISVINDHIERIATLEVKPQLGWMEPIIDPMQQTTDDVGHKIVGARFVLANDVNDPRITTIICKHPEQGWKHRYYKGTDPIMNSSGVSEFATAIWDKEHDELSALMSFRDRNHKMCFLQAMLLGIYYGHNVYDLIENNIGQPYIDYVSDKGYGHAIVPNSALPYEYRSVEGNALGLNKKRGNVPSYLSNNLIKIIDVHGNKVNAVKFWAQLKTYIRKNKTDTIDNNQFKVSDPKYSRDDSIDAVNYAFLCSQSFIAKTPQQFAEHTKTKSKKRYGYYLDENYVMQLGHY